MATKTIMLASEQVKEKSALTKWLDRKNSYFTFFAQEGETVTNRQAFGNANKLLSVFSACSLTAIEFNFIGCVVSACLLSWVFLAWRKEIVR